MKEKFCVSEVASSLCESHGIFATKIFLSSFSRIIKRSTTIKKNKYCSKGYDKQKS